MTQPEQLPLPLLAWSVLCRHCGGPVSPPFGYTHGPTTSRAIHPGCVRPGDTPPFDEARWRAATAVKRVGRAPGDGPAAATGIQEG